MAAPNPHNLRPPAANWTADVSNFTALSAVIAPGQRAPSAASRDDGNCNASVVGVGASTLTSAVSSGVSIWDATVPEFQPLWYVDPPGTPIPELPFGLLVGFSSPPEVTGAKRPMLAGKTMSDGKSDPFHIAALKQAKDESEFKSAYEAASARKDWLRAASAEFRRRYKVVPHDPDAASKGGLLGHMPPETRKVVKQALSTAVQQRNATQAASSSSGKKRSLS